MCGWEDDPGPARYAREALTMASATPVAGTTTQNV
jgi:hypothetical protein